MKRPITVIIGLLALICVCAILLGITRSALMTEIEAASMTLVSDTADTSDFDAKLYEMAYSSPVAPEKIGLGLEAILAKKFESFSSNENTITLGMAKKLKGWPLNKTFEIDLSNSSVSDAVIKQFGKLPATEWVDLSATKVTEKAVFTVLKNAPKIRKLQLKNTDISWSPELVDALLRSASLKEVELDQNDLDSASLTKLKAGMAVH